MTRRDVERSMTIAAADVEVDEPAGYCPGCGYQMNAGRCPECGLKVTDAALVLLPPRRYRHALAILCCSMVVGAIGFMTVKHRKEIVAFVELRWPPTSHLIRQYELGGTQFPTYEQKLLDRFSAGLLPNDFACRFVARGLPFGQVGDEITVPWVGVTNGTYYREPNLLFSYPMTLAIGGWCKFVFMDIRVVAPDGSYSARKYDSRDWSGSSNRRGCGFDIFRMKQEFVLGPIIDKTKPLEFNYELRCSGKRDFVITEEVRLVPVRHVNDGQSNVMIFRREK